MMRDKSLWSICSRPRGSFLSLSDDALVPMVLAMDGCAVVWQSYVTRALSCTSSRIPKSSQATNC